MRATNHLCVALACSAVFLSGCSRRPDPQTAARPLRNVVFIVLDTLRADHVGCYGYTRPTTPHLDRFAAHATLYRDCIATAPWTLPSHAAMFTGKYPFADGVHSFIPKTPQSHDAYPLPLRDKTLAEVLKDAGFQTAAFVDNEAYLGLWTQVNQGFDTYFVKYMYAAQLLPHAVAWLNERGDTPFFLFINLMDTHYPYNVTPRPGFLPEPVSQDPKGCARRFAQAVLPPGGRVPADLRQTIIDQCDTAIANVDEQVGKFLETLRTLKLYDDTLIVIAADHGEYFGGHLLTGHSKDVYQPALKVPLIVKHAGQTQGRVVTQRVSLAMPPHLICADLPAPARERALEVFPAVAARPILTENYYSRSKDLFNRPWSERFRRVRAAIYDGTYKYIASSDGANELYDLQRDPNEATNLVRTMPDVAARLAGELARFRGPLLGTPPAPARKVKATAEQLRVLKSLGYVDSPDANVPAPETRPTEPDGGE